MATSQKSHLPVCTYFEMGIEKWEKEDGTFEYTVNLNLNRMPGRTIVSRTRSSLADALREAIHPFSRIIEGEEKL